ncbi:MAG: methyltransferase domain-containing protein, partial [Planctomycetes bacterium]|nr:methyltransferase domain-containing protein [Planctomycetota bacterium]
MNLDDVRKSFGPQAGHYANPQSAVLFGDPAHLQRMVALTGAAPGVRALDVATGTGYTAFELARAGCDVVALDLTRPMMLEARAAAQKENIGVRFAEGDAHRFPFGDASFNLVACRLAPHHFPEPMAFVRESARVLAPGGKLYVFDISSPEDDSFAH